MFDVSNRNACAGFGRDNGPPGLRTDGGPGGCAAFRIGGDGNNAVVVCHLPMGG